MLYSVASSVSSCVAKRCALEQKLFCFQDTDISQGSVATHLRCGGIFSDQKYL